MPEPGQQIGSDLLLRTAGIVLMIGTFLAGVASALVVRRRIDQLDMVAALKTRG